MRLKDKLKGEVKELVYKVISGSQYEPQFMNNNS